MPTFDEWWAARAPGIIAGGQPLATVDTDIAEELLTLGAGGLDAFLDFIQRPFRAVAHGAAGTADVLAGRDPFHAFGQVVESFDPFNLITPNAPSERITGGDVLERFGVPEGPRVDLPLLGDIGSLRSVAGFAAEIPMDPITWLPA